MTSGRETRASVRVIRNAASGANTPLVASSVTESVGGGGLSEGNGLVGLLQGFLQVQQLQVNIMRQGLQMVLAQTQAPRMVGPCTFCGKGGHKVDSCWRAQGKCLICGSADHKMKDCPRNFRTVGLATSTVSVSKGNPSMGAPSVAQSVGRGRGRQSGPLPTQHTAFMQFKRQKRCGKYAVAKLAGEKESMEDIATSIIPSFLFSEGSVIVADVDRDPNCRPDEFEKPKNA